MEKMNFEFTEQEITYICEMLKKKPYEECYNLIHKIVGQYNAQKKEEKK